VPATDIGDVQEMVEQMRCIGCRLCCITCPDMAIEMRVNGAMYHYFSY
jgi:Fe-S-cluster-containing hydrogenase component 2